MQLIVHPYQRRLRELCALAQRAEAIRQAALREATELEQAGWTEDE